MAFCPQCGSRNPDGARFCSECGHTIPAPAQSTQTPPQQTPVYPPQMPPQSPYTPPVYSQQPPAYTPPVHPQSSLAQPPYVPPVPGPGIPPVPPTTWTPETPKRSFPWGIVIVLAILAILIVGCIAVDIVSDGEFNLFGLLENDDRDRDRDDEDEDEDEDKPDRNDSQDTSPIVIPGVDTPATMPAPIPVETIAPTEPAAEVHSYDIRIWCSEQILDLTLEQINRFNSENPYGIWFNATLEVVYESDAASYMISDIPAGADLYCFAQDQTARLVKAGALSAPASDFAQQIRKDNDAGTVSGASLYDIPYAYPITSDNGYFMYYDKSVISEKDAESLEALIAACEASGTSFCFELENAWYLSSFFFATGCHSQWITDEQGNFIGVDDTFYSEEGRVALEGMLKLLNSSSYHGMNMTYALGNGASVAISGIWEYSTAAAALGDNLGIADLPSFTVDGVSYHLGSFSGCKLMGVKPQADAAREEALHILAQYLTNEQCQLERYYYAGWGPSNVNAQQSKDVQSSPALAALYQQAAYAVAQGQFPGSWWDIAKKIPTDALTSPDPMTALALYQLNIESLLG